MAKRLRVVLELGPKGKRVVALAPDWPGLARGATSEEAALERLRSYVPRYAPVAERAGMETEFANIKGVNVVERYPGTGSTDFWGISFGLSTIDQKRMSEDVLERHLTLLRASWSFFDHVRARVSAEMQKGPRGGGRDRDQIVRHIFANEQDWVKGLGVETPDDAILTARGWKKHRDAYCRAIRGYHSEGRSAGKRPLRYVIRHTAFHALDHAWEMEDKDLSARQG